MRKSLVRIQPGSQKNLLPWCNGSITVSKTADRGSNPLGSANKFKSEFIIIRRGSLTTSDSAKYSLAIVVNRRVTSEKQQS